MGFGKCCKEMAIRPSVGTVGNTDDNVMAESFIVALEWELINCTF